MKIGPLDRRIVIEQATESRGQYGKVDKSWSTLATVWAQIQYKSASERYEADQLTSMNVIIFNIRYRSDLTAEMRINYNSQYYYITAVEHFGRQEGTRLLTELRD